MRVMIEMDAWPYVICDDQEELDAMEKYWGWQYVDIPYSLWHKYRSALEMLSDAIEEIEKYDPVELKKKRVKEYLNKKFDKPIELEFVWLEDELGKEKEDGSNTDSISA